VNHGANLFNAWMEREGLSNTQAGVLFGISSSLVSSWKHGYSVPSLPFRERIALASAGSISVEVWKERSRAPVQSDLDFRVNDTGAEPDFTGQDIEPRILPKTRMNTSVYAEQQYGGSAAGLCAEAGG
jgi:hypothetical protein